MNIASEKLDTWRAQVHSARQYALSVAGLVLRNQKQTAIDRAETAAETLRVLGLDMEQSGAQRPERMRPAPEVPLPLLDTPANRRYAAALRAAWEAGLAVDRERYGDTIGTDGPAQMLEMMLQDVEAELHGPAGVRD